MTALGGPGMVDRGATLYKIRNDRTVSWWAFHGLLRRRHLCLAPHVSAKCSHGYEHWQVLLHAVNCRGHTMPNNFC